MPKKASPYDLIAVVASTSSPGDTYEIKRHRITQHLGCSCTSFAMAPTCPTCHKLLTRRSTPERTIYSCPRCKTTDVPKSCKHTRAFAAGQGKPAPVAVAEAMLAAASARRAKSGRGTITALLQQPTSPLAPLRAIVLPDED